MSLQIAIPADGHTLAATLREMTDAGGDGVEVQLKPASPFSGDPEFDSSDLSAWSQANTSNATTIDANTSLKNHLFFDLNGNNSDWYNSTTSGPFVYQTISGNFDVYARVAYGEARNYHAIRILAQSTSTSNDFVGIALARDSANTPSTPRFHLISSNNGTNNVDASTYATDGVLIGRHIYIRMKRTTNDFSCYYSVDGVSWTQLTSSPVTRSDFSSDANLGITANTSNTSNRCKASCDFIRTWPPYDTSSPVSSIVVDSGASGTVWDMSTFNALVNASREDGGYRATVRLGTLKYQYGAGESSPPSLNGSHLTEAQMQSEGDPTGRYFKLQVQYNSANGYELASFHGATITASLTSRIGVLVNGGLAR